MHVVLDKRRINYMRYVVVSAVTADEVRRFAPLPRTVYLVLTVQSWIGNYAVGVPVCGIPSVWDTSMDRLDYPGYNDQP